ncbi:fibronectin type III domain-containing protein 7-like [Mastacembelus armatus]|uniref:fibronectin type III domain-containing protein 7-like n=1 Tax=Mastacembelus armatus TaxID=205130 RepID=UPI000E45A2DC|nr:fibronectin type III domain-containing protein 7-like [Mastacembelus armatus]
MGTMQWMVIFVVLGTWSQVATQSAIKVSVFSATSKAVTLKWTRYSGASSYKITVAPKSSPNSPIAFARFGPNTVMGSVISLSPNIMYIFTIEALDNSLTTLSRDTTESSTAPDMMDPIQTVQPKDSRTLTAEFLLQTGATNYIIRVQNTNGFFREDTVSSSPAEIKSLTPYTEYMLSIMAVNSGGHSQPTLPVTARTVLPPPQISTSSPSNDSIIVSWAPVPHAVQYSLSINKFGSNTSMTFNTSNTNLTISGLDAGSLYVISGFAWDMEGRKGERSFNLNQTTRPPTPSSVNVSVVISNAVAGLSVSWKLNQEVYGSIQYSVMSNQNLTCNATSSSCTLSPVNCGEVHIIQVTASNKAGPSLPSSPKVFTTFPCPPESLAVVESTDGNCTLTWNTVPYADSYLAIIKRGNFGEKTCPSTSNNCTSIQTGDSGGETCNTTSSSCTFYCQCGYTYLMSVLAFNQAGSSPQGKTVNYTTLPCCPEGVSVSVVSTDTLEITWTASRGADLYETRAADSSEVIRCNDTAPVCALSDLDCDSPYSVVVTPCNEISGCNRACKAYTKDTAPCMPTSLVLNLRNSTSVSVSWAANNRAALYTVSARGDDGMRTCTSPGNSCVITGLLCGSTYEISVIANNTAGQSLPSYSDLLETEPCCPVNLTVDQVTQAVTNVSWSITRGARSFITSLTSPRGNARCHTRDSSCLMGCITCGTNYTIAMEAISLSGRRSNCTYQGFSSSACCPSGVRLYRMAGNSLRVYWRSSGSHSYTVEMVGSSKNYTCTAAHGDNSCDVGNVQCGDVYHVVVAPLTPEGKKVLFCPRRLYSVICSGDNIGTVIYRGKRSVD